MRARARAYTTAFRRPDGALRGDLRGQGVPLHRRLPAVRRGGTRRATWPPAASCTLRWRGGFDPARIYMHGNNKSQAELDYAVEAGVGHIVVDSFDEIERLARARPSACCCA